MSAKLPYNSYALKILLVVNVNLSHFRGFEMFFFLIQSLSEIVYLL